MSSLIWRQTKILLWKNFLLKSRMIPVLLQETLWPIYFVVCLIITKLTGFKTTVYPEVLTTYSQPAFRNSLVHGSTIFYVPNTSHVSNVMSKLRDVQYDGTNLFTGLTLQGFSTPAEMTTAYMNNNISRADWSPKLLGVEFESASSLQSYTIRFPYSTLPGADLLQGPGDLSCRTPEANDTTCAADSYFNTGFITLQLALDTLIIQEEVPSYSLFDVNVQPMPKHERFSDTTVLQYLTSFYLVFALGFFMMFLLAFVVTEKEKKIKEGMQIMGMRSVSLWLSWSLTYAVVIFVMTLALSLIAVYGQLFPNSSVLLIFLFMFMYGLTVEILAFMVTPFFSKAKSATGFGGLASLMFVLPFLCILLVPDFPLYGAYLLSLLSPTSFAIGLNQISLLEASGEGAHFSNIMEGQYPLLIPMIMLPVDIVLYFILTLYLDSVIPGEYGRKEKPWFCLLPSFWLGRYRNRVPLPATPSSSDGRLDAGMIEDISQDMQGKEAIRISNLGKTFYPESVFGSKKEGKQAVKNFSLDIYQGQITALLGHNGAGKTTIFNILTGFIESTQGDVHVFDYDVSDMSDMQQIRQMTGFCPQHDILFDQLSVREHLQIFAGIKNLPEDTVDSEVNKIIDLVDLTDKADTRSKDLSGGQKRKLSVGIAILGDPKILILDEPTAGMDPLSRRKLWNLLRSRTVGTVTLLTTHFMDEADILADRKAIISKGQLKCVGSSLFLKNRFGIGYRLGVVTSEDANTDIINAIVTSHVQDVTKERDTLKEIDYNLPSKDIDKFADLFKDLETNGDGFGVKSFGVSMTTLEEVFLKIGEESENEEEETEERNKNTNNHPKQPLINASFTNAVTNPTHEDLDDLAPIQQSSKVFNPDASEVGVATFWDLLFANMTNKMINYMRNPGFLIFGMLIPIGLAIGSCAVFTLGGPRDTDDPEAVVLTSTNYGAGELLYKNSTGSPLTTFEQHSSFVSLEYNDLNPSKLLDRGTNYAYSAVDLKAFDTTKSSYTAWYNTSGYHTLPGVINTLSSISYSNAVNQTRSITAKSKRWPQLNKMRGFQGGTFGGVILAAFALAITTSGGMFNLVTERELKIRGQLTISGMRFTPYYLSHLCIDYIVFLSVGIAFIIATQAFQVDAFKSLGAIVSLIFIIVLWGFGAILSSYCGSFIYDKAETAQSSWTLVLELFCFLPYTVVSMLDQFVSKTVSQALHIVFSIFVPYYAGFGGLYYTAGVYIDWVLLGNQGIPPSKVYFDWSYPMVPLSMILTFVQNVIIFYALKIIDIKHHGGKAMEAFGISSAPSTGVGDGRVTPCEEEGIDFPSAKEDDDVLQERQHVNQYVDTLSHIPTVPDLLNVNSEPVEDPVVVVQNLKKRFVTRKKKQETVKVAVDGVSFAVFPGQVFGLLGPNGAGKTTTIDVITAQTGPTKGKVYVSRHCIESNTSEVFNNMGYCSQSNPLWEELTIREHLKFYSVARGVTKSSIPATIDSFLTALGIVEHADKRVKETSGGTKRKLCFAIALLGNPQVVLLDEPSTGMDPKTKRFMWDTISSAFEGTNRGAILTTHYMDEADALCNKIAIMVAGKLKCIGSTQHLKSKFGQGYVLEVKLKPGSNSSIALHQFVDKLFPGIDSPECFGDRYVYKVALNLVTDLSQVFSEMQRVKQQLNVEDYSFSQATLEQVFLRFAREQKEED